MTEQEYLAAVQAARAQIERGGEEDLRRAEAGLAALRRIYPKRLPYIAAEVALMLARGADAEECRAIVDYTVQEYHPQEGLSDLFALKARTYAEERPERRQLALLAAFYGTGAMPQDAFDALAVQKAAFAERQDPDTLHALAVQYYVTRNTLLSSVLMLAWCRMTGRMEEYGAYVLMDAGRPYPHPAYHGNFPYLARMLTDGNAYTFLLVDDAAGDAADMAALSAALHMLGQNTLLLRECDGVQEVQDAETYALDCIQAAQAVGDDVVITAGRCRTSSGAVVDPAPALVRILARSVTQDAPLIVFARDVRMGALHARTSLAGDIQRLSHRLPPAFSYGLSFAWAGDYLKYLGYLYGEDVRQLLSAPPTCDFSIVIPVRNAADTLRHTLETCLASEDAGSYEVVVSDNSDAGVTAIEDLCAEMGDPRIRYVRTPVPLPLDKSFEYAFLHARGAFVFAIGADDGIYPWTLRCLAQVLAAHPDEQLFAWRRDLYMWPGLLPHGRSFLTVSLCEAGAAASASREELASRSGEVVAHIDEMFYDLPLCYINSGFRRGYLQMLLQRTGRLLDGVSQDAYMGTVNLLLNDHFVKIDAPLVIAGMSGRSIGAGTQLFPTDIAAAAAAGAQGACAQVLYGEYVPRDGEYMVPVIDTADKYGVYVSLARLQEIGRVDAPLPADAMFDYLGQWMNLADLGFERFSGLMLHAAALCSREKECQCRAFCERLCAEPAFVGDAAPELFSDYPTGYFAASGMLRLDARAFGCRNVKDAADLAARILCL